MTPADIIAAEFDRCAHWIAAAIPYCNGTYTIEDVKAACISGRMQLWPGKRSALTTEICEFPQRTGCLVSFAGGDLEELRAMAPAVKQWAKERGCDFWAVNGRRGWARALGFGRVVSTYSAEDF